MGSYTTHCIHDKLLFQTIIWSVTVFLSNIFNLINISKHGLMSELHQWLNISSAAESIARKMQKNCNS